MHRSASAYVRWGKRLTDVVLAMCGIMVTAPIFAACALAVKLDSRGPVLFRQRRVGRNLRPFQIVKFRTMLQDTEERGPSITASDDTRITRVGRRLRQTKLDELPQLINVLAGDLSIVGPRPEVPQYVAEYTATQRTVLAIRPGITGPASLHFINEQDLLAHSSQPDRFYREVLMPQKLELDLSYCRNVSLLVDVHLIASTALRLVLPSRFNKRRTIFS